MSRLKFQVQDIRDCCTLLSYFYCCCFISTFTTIQYFATFCCFFLVIINQLGGIYLFKLCRIQSRQTYCRSILPFVSNFVLLPFCTLSCSPRSPQCPHSGFSFFSQLWAHFQLILTVTAISLPKSTSGLIYGFTEPLAPLKASSGS